MRLSIISSSLLLITFLYVRCDDDHDEHETAKTHVAIVGAGIGGIATAYWLKHYLNESIAITIYETDQVGGRLRTIEIDGNRYEAGGSILHEKNLYMKRFLDELGLTRINEPTSPSYIMTKDGSETLFSTLSRYIPNVFLTLWRYGFDAVRLKVWLSQKLSNFVRIYDYQDNGKTFETVDEFLKLLDEEFYLASRQSFRKYLFSKGFKKRFIDEIGQVGTLVNYDQSVDGINGFPGLVSLMAAGSALWHVQGGNFLIPKMLLENLLKQKDVQFVQGHVKSIEEVHRIDKDDQGGDVRLAYQPKNSQLVHSVDYDYIIVAFPLHRDNLEDFHISSNKFNQNQFRMQSTHANFLHGTFNCSRFQLTNDDCQRLKAIFYTDSSLPYRSVAQQRPVDHDGSPLDKTETSVYKVFSPDVLSYFDYEKIFNVDQFELVQNIPWLAYPKYNHPQSFPPIRLNKNVFYVNAMEWSASCMEIEAISARNIAMLLTKQLGIKLKRVDKHEEF